MPGPAISLVADQARNAEASYVASVFPARTCAGLVSSFAERSDAFEGGRKLTRDGWSDTPRRVASFADRPFRFVDMRPPKPFFALLDSVRRELEIQAGHPFNYALVNWYRDSEDFAGWHADKVEFHIPGTSIAILSLGAARTFAIRDVATPGSVVEVAAEEGSVIWMRGSTQDHYEHSVPRAINPVAARWSVTFRCLNEELVDRRAGREARG